MQASTEQCQTVQQYICMLFDDLPPVRLDQTSNNHLLHKQIASYGRKIIQLSQQSTFKYRQEHFISKSQVEQEIAVIYRLITGDEPSSGYDKMLKEIVQKLQWDKKSIWARQSLPESRIIMTPVDVKTQERKHVLEEEKMNTKPPRAKSKQASSKVSTVKETLQIKGYFENQETIIRECYDKVAKLLEINKVQISCLAPQALKFSRMKNENTTEKIIDLVKNTTENHGENINNLYHLVEALHDNLQKRLKNQGAANSKISAYLQQVKRMEEVYSYSISKILENAASIKTMLKKDPSLCAKHIENVQEISHKLYSLFPNSQYFQSISVTPHGIPENKSYGVQVNFNKTNVERKTGTQTYRLQIRLFELLDKFEKNMKFKKTIQIKEVQRLFDTLKQVLPSCKNMTAQDLNYQEEFRKIVEVQDQKEKQMNEVSSKKYKKYEKRIQQLEKAIEDLQIQFKTSGEHWQQQKRKLTKKLEHQRSELNKLMNVKSHLESNISQMLKQIEDMRQAVRRQGHDQAYQRKLLQRQKQELIKSSEETTAKFSQNLEDLKTQKQRIFEERIVYRQKIQLAQKQLEEEQVLSTGLKLQLQAVINEHQTLRAQLAEMGVLYEQKIREVEQMIQNIRQLQQIKETQEKTISVLTMNQESAKEKLNKQANYIQGNLTSINQLTQQNEELKKQLQHWKQESKLTDADLKALKDQVDKVNSAYVETENNLDSVKQQLNHVTEEREKIFKEKLKLSRAVEELEGQVNSLRTRYQAVELAQRDMKDEYYHKCQEIVRLTKQVEQQKRQLLKSKKELSQERDSRANSEKQMRQLRLDLQSKRQIDSVEHGKRRLQLENLRVQLRKKSQQLQKQRESYEQKIGIMTQRMQDLQQSMGQKQLLSRLLQHHSK